MAMLSVLLGMNQKCPACGQSSNPRVGRGNWEIMGLWNGSINRCTKCSRLVRVGFMTDQMLTPDEADRFLKARAASLR
jgi:ribosomal protein L37AE/L43A